MWGGVVMYFTSHFRATNPDLYLETTLYTVPITLAALTGGMQLGAWLFHKIEMSHQIMIGASIFSASIYFAQYMETFSGFLAVYAWCAGIGIGIIWVLPVACAWSYFPAYRAPVAGSIFSWLGISTIMWSHIANHTVNPSGEAGTIIHDSGRG
jgi:MFS family permease